jgi:hypothetical protein
MVKWHWGTHLVSIKIALKTMQESQIVKKTWWSFFKTQLFGEKSEYRRSLLYWNIFHFTRSHNHLAWKKPTGPTSRTRTNILEWCMNLSKFINMNESQFCGNSATRYIKWNIKKPKKYLASESKKAPKNRAQKSPGPHFGHICFFVITQKVLHLEKTIAHHRVERKKTHIFISIWGQKSWKRAPQSPIIDTGTPSDVPKKCVISKSSWASAKKKTQEYVPENGPYTECSCDR